MSSTYFNIYPTLTPADLSSPVNISGVYFNGISNNGLKATLTIEASTLTIDGIEVVNGNRILLPNQTNTNENGIYTVSGLDVNVTLTRAPDFQNVEQLLGGQTITIGNGNSLAGHIYSVVEPLPNVIGIDPITFIVGGGGGGTAANKNASNNSLPTVASVSGSTVVNHVLVAADTAGTVKDSNGVVAIAAGGLQAGSSGVAGTLSSFPPAAGAGQIVIQAANSGAGDFSCTITNEPVNQNSTYILPSTNIANNTLMVDPFPSIVQGNIVIGGFSAGVLGDAGYFLVTNTASTTGESATITFTDANITVDSILVVTINTITTAGGYLLSATPEEGQFTAEFNAPPGETVISYFYTSVAS